MKKIINDPEQVVDEMLTGMVMAHPEIVRVDGFNVLLRKKDRKKDKVTLISGGGSGHEPAHGGFIGYGMLDAAVSGEVFTSPTPDQILEAIKAVNTGKGSLLIVKNYSGDVMNFEMASEMAEMDGIEVEQVIINDDVAVEDSTYTTGRRGIAGTIFVHKIAGAMAEKGASLSEVKRVAQKAINNLRSKGMALSSCTVPSVGKPTFEIAEDEMEVGLGIHGEPGVEKIKIKSAAEIAENLVDSIVEDLPFKSGDEVALLINGLGSTPLMELYILNKSVQDLCRKRGIKVYKTYVDEYMTSLEMAGASVSMLKLDDELKELLDEPADTLVLKQGGKKDD